MNAISTQFPELPTPAAVLERTWRATWFVGESKLDHGIEQHAVYTADQVHQYARDYAASQTAGVPDRKTLFEQAEVLAACYRLKELVEGVGCERWQNANGFRLKDTQQWVEFYNVVNRMQRLEYPPAAAPAASGGEDYSACCDTPAYCSSVRRCTAKDSPQPPSAASVSERARHGVVRATVRATDEDDVLHIECRFDDGQKYAAIETSGHRCEELAGFIVSALEQAMTQQRGEREDAHKFRRLAQLLDGFDFRLGRNALMPPATYLDSVEITCEFQPGVGQTVIDAIVDVLATGKGNG